MRIRKVKFAGSKRSACVWTEPKSMSEVHNPEASICNGMWPMVHGVREV